MSKYRHPVVVVKNSDSPDDNYNEALADFANKRICEGAVNALQILEESPAHVVIAETGLADMNALELAQMIRDIDLDKQHYTYLVLISSRIDQKIRDAFDHEIDALVSPSNIELIRATAIVGCRIAERINDLSLSTVALIHERDQLRTGQLLDPLTGLGNRKLAEQALKDAIRQIESRGGAVCFMTISIGNLATVRAKHDDHITDELIIVVSERIHSLVRPMDTVCHLGDGVFALILLQPAIENCTAECYQRIFDGIRLKSYRTAVGFLDTTIGVSICASHAENGPPNPDTMISVALDHLPEAITEQKIQMKYLSK